LYLGGILGAFMTGLFSQQSVNPTGGFDGAFYGRPIQLWYQLVGILTAIGNSKKKTIFFSLKIIVCYLILGFAAACTAGILYPLDWIMGIRLGKEDEIEGLDLTGIEHSFIHQMKK
jgi:ammonia channel protein AmtB